MDQERVASEHPTLLRKNNYSKFRSAAWEGREQEGKRNPWNEDVPRLKVDEKASKAVNNLVLAAFKDEEMTVMKMDEFDPRFVCLKCSYVRKCDGVEMRMRVLSWRDAVSEV